MFITIERLETKNMIIPNYLTPVGDKGLTGALELIKAPVLKTDEDGAPKTSTSFPGRTPYVVSLELIRGIRTKRLPNGESVDLPDTQQLNATLWMEGVAPDYQVGDYVVLDTPMVGAFNGSIFVNALGLKGVDTADGLEEMLGGNDA